MFVGIKRAYLKPTDVTKNTANAINLEIVSFLYISTQADTMEIRQNNCNC